MHCLSCGVRRIVGTGDLCDPCRRHWEGGAVPEEPRRDIIPPFGRKDSAMIRCGARHIANALRAAHRLGGRLDPAGTRLEAERAPDGTVQAKGPDPGQRETLRFPVR